MKKWTRKETVESIVDLLMDHPPIRRARGLPKSHYVPKNAFLGSVALITSLAGDEKKIFATPECFSTMRRRHVSACSFDEEQGDRLIPKYASMRKVARRRVPSEAFEWIPQAAMVLPELAFWELSTLRLFDGRFTPIRTFAATARYGEAVNVFGQDQDIKDCVTVLAGIELTDQYEWSVDFIAGEGLSIRLWCDPAGCLRLLNDREVEPGRKRRAALQHWVDEHWRRKATGDISKVREHIRGTQKIHWRGWDCVVRPSLFDAEKAKAKWRADTAFDGVPA